MPQNENDLQFGEAPVTPEEVLEALDQRDSWREYQKDYRQERYVINSDEL